MHRISLSIAAALLGASSLTHAAEGSATAEQATAMVKKGVASIKANGADKGYAEITSKTGQFRFQDLHPTVYNMDGALDDRTLIPCMPVVLRSHRPTPTGDLP